MATWVFAAAYAVAFALLLVGQWGLFGAERTPLAGIFLVPLGLPWNLALDIVPEGMLPVLGALAPLVNLLLLGGICRALRGRR